MAYYRLLVNFPHYNSIVWLCWEVAQNYHCNGHKMMNTRSKGNVGEDVACKFVQARGFDVIVRNYMKKWGEIDIIAIKDRVIHFFEVKSVTFDPAIASTSHKAEENVHGFKVRQIRRMVETYLSESNRGPNTEFTFHVLSVYLNMVTRKARVKWLKDVIL